LAAERRRGARRCDRVFSSIMVQIRRLKTQTARLQLIVLNGWRCSSCRMFSGAIESQPSDMNPRRPSMRFRRQYGQPPGCYRNDRKSIV
jgi:hypothetical protein